MLATGLSCRFVVAIGFAALWSCAQPVANAGSAAPTLAQARQATYQGLEGAPDTFAMRDGVWEGAPYMAGGAARPRVVLAEPFHISGDLDGDGQEEAVVLLSYLGGGSGEFVYFAVLAGKSAGLQNIATVPLGDRVEVVEAAIENGILRARLLQAGSSDAACCPGELVSRAWRLDTQHGLQRVTVDEAAQRLTLDVLGGYTWRLRAWAFTEPLLGEVVPTLQVNGDRLVGFAGCNRYFAAANSGKQAGDLEIGAVGATRMACPEPATAVEDRFLALLGKVSKFSFLGGQLALTYIGDDGAGTMLFERTAAEQ